MRRAERIMLAFKPRREACRPARLPHLLHGGAAACQQLVDIALMSDIEDNPVIRRLKGAVQRDGEFDHAEVEPRCPPLAEVMARSSPESPWPVFSAFQRAARADQRALQYGPAAALSSRRILPVACKARKGDGEAEDGAGRGLSIRSSDRLSRALTFVAVEIAYTSECAGAAICRLLTHPTAALGRPSAPHVEGSTFPMRPMR